MNSYNVVFNFPDRDVAEKFFAIIQSEHCEQEMFLADFRLADQETKRIIFLKNENFLEEEEEDYFTDIFKENLDD